MFHAKNAKDAKKTSSSDRDNSYSSQYLGVLLRSLVLVLVLVLVLEAGHLAADNRKS